MKKSMLFLIWSIALLVNLSPVFALIQSVSLVPDPIFGTNKNVLLLHVDTLYSDYVQFSETKSSQDLSSQSGANVQNPFTLSFQTTDDYATYDVTSLQHLDYLTVKSSQNNWLYGWSQTDAQSWVNSYCADVNGDGQKSYYIHYGLAFSGTGYLDSNGNPGSGYVIKQMWCAYKNTPAGDVYAIGKPNPYWNVQFTLNNGQNNLPTQSINSNNLQALNIQNSAYIRFDGIGLISYPTYPSNVYVLKSYSGSSVVFDAYKLSQYQSLIQRDANSLVQQVADNQMSISTFESTFSSVISQMQQPTNIADWNPQYLTFSAKADGSPLLKLQSKQQIGFQNFNIYLNGDWIKIIIPTGIPQIQKPLTTNFGNSLTATNGGIVTANVKNAGNSIATFTTSFTCSSSSVTDSGQIINNINAGETRQIQFHVNSIQPSQQFSDSCNLIVKDSTNPNNMDTTSISYTVVPKAVCDNGHQVANQENGIWKVYTTDSACNLALQFSCTQGQQLAQDSSGKYSGCQDIKTSTITCPAGTTRVTHIFTADTCESNGSGTSNGLNFQTLVDNKDSIIYGSGAAAILLSTISLLIKKFKRRK